MKKWIDRFLAIHRFLIARSFYPILLSSILSITIYTGRVFLSGVWVVYANLVWNLILAWIPYLFSGLAVLLNQFFPRKWWLLIIPASIWLVFFPNTAYILTDFFHLELRPNIPLWYDILLLASFSWTGIFLGIASLNDMQDLVTRYLGRIPGWIFVGITLSLSGIGIYLGRFDRWNSWDILFHYERIFLELAHRMIHPFSNLSFFGFTILFTAFLLVCYLMFTNSQRNASPEALETTNLEG